MKNDAVCFESVGVAERVLTRSNYSITTLIYIAEVTILIFNKQPWAISLFCT
jgi:hypothetical protein